MNKSLAQNEADKKTSSFLECILKNFIKINRSVSDFVCVDVFLGFLSSWTVSHTNMVFVPH